jgi:hypothetical protein
VRESLERVLRYPEAAPHEARGRMSDLVRLTARLRRLRERLGGLDVAQVSEYLAEMLRVAANADAKWGHLAGVTSPVTAVGWRDRRQCAGHLRPQGVPVSRASGF